MKLARICLLAGMVSVFFILGYPQVEGSMGDIEGTIDYLEFDTSDAVTPEVHKVNSNYIAIVYEGVDSDGFLKTIRVEDNGDLSDAVVDTIEFDTNNCMNPDMIQLVDNDNVYVIAYQGADGDGWLATVEIFENGEITDNVVDSFEFDTSQADTPDLLHVSGDVYMIVYMGPQSDGWVVTVEILDNGDITDPAIETFEADATSGLTPHVVHYIDNIFVVAYEDTGSNGTLISFIVLENGDLQPPRIDDYVFNPFNGLNPDLHMDDNIAVVFYQGAGDDGWATTVEMWENGYFDTELDSFEWDTDTGITPDEIEISDDPHIYAVAYEGKLSDGWLVTFELDLDNGIFLPVIDRFEFDTDQGEYPDIALVDGNTYIVTYTGPDGDGWVQSIEIQSTPEWCPIENWTGTLNSPATWYEIETWTGTVNAPENVGWVVVDDWTGTITTPAAPPVPPPFYPPTLPRGGAAAVLPTPTRGNLVLDIEVELLDVVVSPGDSLIATVTITNFASYWNEIYVTGSIGDEIITSEILRAGADSQNEMILEAVAPEYAGTHEFIVNVYYEESRMKIGTAIDTFEVVSPEPPPTLLILIVIVAMVTLFAALRSRRG